MEDILHRWLMFLGNPNEEVLHMLETKDSSIAKATKVLDLLSSDPETVRLSELRVKAIWDEVSRINGAIKEREFNIAIKMLDTGSSVEYVAEMTGLSVEEVCNLRQ